MTQVVGVQIPPPAPRRAHRRSHPGHRQRVFWTPSITAQKKIGVMQVTETINDGLKREFKVVVPAADLASKADERLDRKSVV